MPYPDRVKNLAYKLDPDCWVSYSGKSPGFKARMDCRRSAALEKAEMYFNRRACVVFSFAPRRWGKRQTDTNAEGLRRALNAVQTELDATKAVLKSSRDEVQRLKDALVIEKDALALERSNLESLMRAHRDVLKRVEAEHKIRVDVANALRENCNRDDAPATARVLTDTAIAALEL